MKRSVSRATRLVFFTVLLLLLCSLPGRGANRHEIIRNMHYAIIDPKGELVVTAAPNSKASDFDFLLGGHAVHHKKLKDRLAGSGEWIEFYGRHQLQPLFGGRGNLEQHELRDNEGGQMEGVALRLFDPQSRLWTIHWSDSRNCRLDAPVTGSFEGGVGYFYGEDHLAGRPVLVQFKWDGTDPERPVWSQAFSPDRGLSWEWNWFMHFSKTAVLSANSVKDSVGVIELRNYVMKRGKRDTFIPFFERNFVISQDTLHGHILGRYRVEDKADNFCWIRGFENMHTRGVFLPSFYKGPVWRRYRNEANAMLANNDNVYLLKPLKLQGDSLVPAGSVSSGVLRPQKGITVVQFFVANSKLPHLLKLFSGKYVERMRSAGFDRFSFWDSELGQNDFPQLPVFQNKDLLVVISFFNTEADYRAAWEKLRGELPEAQRDELDDTITTTDTWILHPTEKSLEGG